VVGGSKMSALLDMLFYSRRRGENNLEYCVCFILSNTWARNR
jgi:hypothetical protein